MLPGDRRVPSPDPDPLAVRDRVTVVTSTLLLVLAAAAWVSVVASSLQGGDLMMTMSMPLSASDGVAFVLSWALMMTAMMLPSALPMIALYGATQRGAVGPGARGVPVVLFTLVYLAVWAATGVPVYFAHTLLTAVSGPFMAYAIATILVVAGAYQLSSLKMVCLRHCRSPLGFLVGHWRAGRWGSLALGWSHSLYCLACCWALMLVMVAAGAMGLVWVLLITGLVAAEKLVPGGEWIARTAGAVFVLLGAAVAFRPELVAVLRGVHPM